MQGSILGPISFVLYINDLPSNILSHVYVFADDTKFFNIIESPEDQEILQNDNRLDNNIYPLRVFG